MKKIKKSKKILGTIILLILIAIIFWIFYFNQTGTIQHTSQDLKISLKYPRGWYIDDRDYNLLLTNYPSSLNKNLSPNENQIEVFIRKFPRCFSSIEEDLKYPACGENKLNGPDKIISKDVKKLPTGIFYKYTTETPNGEEHLYYFFEKGNKLLWISKEPEASQFEKEFESIINSIRFL